MCSVFSSLAADCQRGETRERLPLHHGQPGERHTSLSDLLLLNASCHRCHGTNECDDAKAIVRSSQSFKYFNISMRLMNLDDTCGRSLMLEGNKSVCRRQVFNPGFPPKRIIMSQNSRRPFYSSCRPESRQTSRDRRFFSSLPRLKFSGQNYRRFVRRWLAWDVAAKPGTVSGLSACVSGPPASPEGFQGYQPGALHARRRQRHRLPAG